MNFLKYSVNDGDAFAPFISTMEGTGAEIDQSGVMFEGDNSAARMLAESLVEFGIMSPLMEGDQDANTKPAESTDMKNAAGTVQAPEVRAAGQKNARRASNSKRKSFDPAKMVSSIIDFGTKYINDACGLVTDELKGDVTELFKNFVNADVKENAGKYIIPASSDENKLKALVNRVIASDSGIAERVRKEKEATARRLRADNDPNRKEVEETIKKTLESIGLDELTGKTLAYVHRKAEEDEEYYSRLTNKPNGTSHLVFGIVQKLEPEKYEELKESGKLTDKGENAASVSQKTEMAKAISQIVGQVEVPDAFNVEIDDSEWDNALITDYGFPMINLTSPLVRDMLRAPEPKQQKRAYKAFKKQLGSDPDVAKALGIGISGTLGLGGGKKEARTDKDVRISTEGVNSDGNVLVEGPISDIANALKNPVDVLKSIAQNKGTPCRRNNLVVMYKEIDGKSGDSNELVDVTPLGVSGGVLVDLNKSVPVPMSHLAAFYSVVDPKASFKSYAKAMAEVNAKSDNAKKGLGDAAADAGKKLLSKIPLLGRSAKKELESKEADAITGAMGELAMYIKENGHPPFYLLKPKSNPKEVDRWSDEDAANGYQMITMVLDGHKAGMILKESTAEALFKVG